jgi:hypothetical protein
VVPPSLPVGTLTLPLAARPEPEYGFTPLQLSVAEVAAVELQLKVWPALISTVDEPTDSPVTLGSSTHEATGLTHWPLAALQSSAKLPVCVPVFVLRTEIVAPPEVVGRLKTQAPPADVV